MKKYFSVIVPVHNAEGFLRKGLESIFSQDFDDFEAVIILDACTDRTEEIVNEYTAYTHHKKLFTEFGKAGMARNAGLDCAEGDWILFMDDDDWYLSGAFRKIAEATMNRTDIDVLAYGFDWKGRGETFQSARKIYPAVWNKAYRREFIGEKRFPDWIHTDDLGFTRRVITPSTRINFLYEPLYHYEFMRPGSVSDKIRNGEYDNTQLPEEIRGTAEGYERWLRSQEF